MAFDPIPQLVHVDSMTKSGSTVATVKLWVDEAVLNLSTSLSILKFTGLIQHNFSDLVIPHFSSRVRPLFEISPSDMSSVSSVYYLDFDSATLPGLAASSMERCAVTSSSKRYVAISIDLKLLSDSLYHLGDHNIYMGAYLRSPNNSYTFDTLLKLRVEAGLINLHSCHSHFLSHANLHTCFKFIIYILWILSVLDNKYLISLCLLSYFRVSRQYSVV